MKTATTEEKLELLKKWNGKWDSESNINVYENGNFTDMNIAALTIPYLLKDRYQLRLKPRELFVYIFENGNQCILESDYGYEQKFILRKFKAVEVETGDYTQLRINEQWRMVYNANRYEIFTGESGNKIYSIPSKNFGGYFALELLIDNTKEEPKELFVNVFKDGKITFEEIIQNPNSCIDLQYRFKAVECEQSEYNKAHNWMKDSWRMLLNEISEYRIFKGITGSDYLYGEQFKASDTYRYYILELLYEAEVEPKPKKIELLGKIVKYEHLRNKINELAVAINEIRGVE